jgi:hypothetical protein
VIRLTRHTVHVLRLSAMGCCKPYRTYRSRRSAPDILKLNKPAVLETRLRHRSVQWSDIPTEWKLYGMSNGFSFLRDVETSVADADVEATPFAGCRPPLRLTPPPAVGRPHVGAPEPPPDLALGAASASRRLAHAPPRLSHHAWHLGLIRRKRETNEMKGTDYRKR